jgi:hypothetical protein
LVMSASLSGEMPGPLGSWRGADEMPNEMADDMDGMMDATPIEFQPESGALGPCEAVDEAERARDPREDL